MAGIFISYRRSDSSAWAGRLYDLLVGAWGRDYVFLDVDTFAPGDDFRASIAAMLSRCDVALVVIGPQWASSMDEHNERRLDDEADIHRTEVMSALESGLLVIPIVVGGASMPKVAELPAPLTDLAYRTAVHLDDRNFRVGFGVLQARLLEYAQEKAASQTAVTVPPVAPAEPEPADEAVGATAAVSAPIPPAPAAVEGASGGGHRLLVADDGARYRRRWLVGLAAVAGMLVVVAVVIGALLAGRDSGGGTDADTASPAASVQETPASSAIEPPPSDRVQPPASSPGLLQVIPTELANLCQPYEPGSGATASAFCSDGATDLLYTLYPVGAAELDEFFIDEVGKTDASEGSCRSGEDSWQRYRVGAESSAEAGRVLCYVVSGEPWLQWTQTDLGVHVVAHRVDGDDLDALLADWEQDRFGPRPAADSQPQPRSL